MAEKNNIVEKQNPKDSTPNKINRGESFVSRMNPIVQGLNSLQESGALGTIADVTKDVAPQAADVIKTTVPYAADVAKDIVHGATEISKDLISLYKDCIDLAGQEGRIKEKELDAMYEKFKTCQQFFAYSFAERNGALQRNYKVLDDAIARGDRDLIIQAMGYIGNIVTSSPLSELQKLLERYDTPDDSLLDF